MFLFSKRNTETFTRSCSHNSNRKLPPEFLLRHRTHNADTRDYESVHFYCFQLSAQYDYVIPCFVSFQNSDDWVIKWNKIRCVERCKIYIHMEYSISLKCILRKHSRVHVNIGKTVKIEVCVAFSLAVKYMYYYCERLFST